MHHLIGRGHDFTEIYNILEEKAASQMYNIRAIVESCSLQDFITDYYHHWKVFGLFNSVQS